MRVLPIRLTPFLPDLKRLFVFLVRGRVGGSSRGLVYWLILPTDVWFSSCGFNVYPFICIVSYRRMCALEARVIIFTFGVYELISHIRFYITLKVRITYLLRQK